MDTTGPPQRRARRWSSTPRSTRWPTNWRSGGSRWSRASSATRRGSPDLRRAHEELRTLIGDLAAGGADASSARSSGLTASTPDSATPNSDKSQLAKRNAQAPQPPSAPTPKRPSHRARRLQVRRVRERVQRVAGDDPRAAGELPAVLRRRVGRARRRLRARRVPRPAEGARHQRPRARSESRDGRSLPRARARRRRGGRRVAISTALPDASLGGLFAAQVVEHLQPGYLLRVPRARVPQAAAGRADRARDAEPGVLDGVLRQLHPRHHARVAAASRDAALPGARQRLLRRAHRVPLAGRAAGSAAAGRPPRGDAASAAAAAADLVETFNANVEKLNARMFTFLDYAIVGGR